jgi:hypothetical protein
MIFDPVAMKWRAMCGAPALAMALLVLGACGNEDRLSPTPEAPITTAAPGDSTGAVDPGPTPSDSSGVVDSTTIIDSTGISTLSSLIAPGIVFGTIELTTSLLSSVHNGTLMGGQIDQNNASTILSATRAKGGRIVIKMCMGRDSFVKNADGTFSFTKWKALVDRFRKVNLGPYITDGTIVGHYLIDEPHRTARWGGKIIPPATLEAMAKYSKSIWPNLTTFVRVAPSWLAGFSTTYNYLDAGWLQYESWMGSVSTKVTNEVAAAKRKGLGLAVGLNVLDGGNGSSRLAGWSRGKYKMSASEISSYGTTLLNQSYSCAFYNWMYDGAYYGRSDIRNAMASLSSKARGHIRTSCRQ